MDKHYQPRCAELFVFYGRRRVGKTERLAHFCEGKPHVFFVADQVPEQVLRSDFSTADLFTAHPPESARTPGTRHPAHRPAPRLGETAVRARCPGSRHRRLRAEIHAAGWQHLLLECKKSESRFRDGDLLVLLLPTIMVDALDAQIEMPSNWITVAEN